MNQLTNLPDPETDTDVTDQLTKEMIMGVVPDKRFRKYVTDDLVDLVNSEPESELRRVFRDNVLSYASVLKGGRFSLAAYVNAVKFVSFKLLGDTSSVAYGKVFPDRYQALIQRGASSSAIASFADNYSKNALVVKIIEQTMVPTHILNAGIYQEAINTQAELMRSAKSEMVRQKAAESLLNNLKAPETAKVEIDVNYSNDTIDELRRTTEELARQQARMIMSGQMNAKEAAHSQIVAKKVEQFSDAEYVDITDRVEQANGG